MSRRTWALASSHFRSLARTREGTSSSFRSTSPRAPGWALPGFRAGETRTKSPVSSGSSRAGPSVRAAGRSPHRVVDLARGRKTATRARAQAERQAAERGARRPSRVLRKQGGGAPRRGDGSRPRRSAAKCQVPGTSSCFAKWSQARWPPAESHVAKIPTLGCLRCEWSRNPSTRRPFADVAGS